jgi:hypothetical protein
MNDSGPVPAEGPREDPTIVVFLGLYLLLLAFFILLNTISAFDSKKSQQATDSVGVAFSEILPPILRSEQELVSKGAVLELDSYQGQVTAALATIIRLVETTSLEGGQLRVTSSVEDLFDKTGEELIEDARIFVDRIAEVLKSNKPGFQRNIEIIIGVGDDLPESVDAGSSLPLRQVATFLHQLIENEVPAEIISIGLSPGSEGGILMLFNPVAVDGETDSENSQ